MNFRVKLRLIGLMASMALVAMGIAWLTVKSQRQASGLRNHLSDVTSESFQIADRFQDYLRQLNLSLYRFGSGHAPADWAQFGKASQELDDWIDAQKPMLASPSEKLLMLQIDEAYTNYLGVAAELRTHLQSLAGQTASIADYAALMSESQRLFKLGQTLAEEHYRSRNVVLTQAYETVRQLRISVLVALGGLFVLGLALAAVVYRDMIAPLRVQLIESRELLERREKLASLGVLAAGVAHEVRNPLTAIKAALFIQQKKFPPDSQEYADAKIIEREILRLEKIVNDFLFFARPTEPEKQPVWAAALLKEVEVLLGPSLARNEIHLTTEDSAPIRVHADAAQIKQVLINLVQNAADATGPKGCIQMRARQGRLRLEGGEANVAILEVEDNGRGIPPEVQKRLFDPFFTTKDSGTGLGLSIAAGIVQKHGGTLQYQTQPGYGTTFGIVLPLPVGETGPRAD